MATPSTWLSLTDYSSKYRVSVSTLRRRIKAEDIKFQFNDGKYLILDEPLEVHHRGHRPSLEHEREPTPVTLPGPTSKEQQQEQQPILSAANKLLNELKRAYTLILQEKEEQILHLHDEVSDLKTLIKVLESENLRLKSTRDHFQVP